RSSRRRASWTARPFFSSPTRSSSSKPSPSPPIHSKATWRPTPIFSAKKRMQELGINTFQTLALASIIEKEAKLEKEKGLISAVFHNRLRTGMTLDADPTVIYGLGSFSRD